MANRAAKAAGLRLINYEEIPVVSHKGHDWIVLYDGKTPAPLPDGRVELKIGNHFGVLVDDRTGEARVILGE
jgi:hypothetical protein